MKFDTYVHIASQMVTSSDSLDNYCCRRARHTTDSYPNFLYIAEHKLSVCLLESNSVFRSNHRSKDDK
jgi:hypothetical protein